jgi:hypothetical protein
MAYLTKCNSRKPEDAKDCAYIIDSDICCFSPKCYWGPDEPNAITCSDIQLEEQKKKIAITREKPI